MDNKDIDFLIGKISGKPKPVMPKKDAVKEAVKPVVIYDPLDKTPDELAAMTHAQYGAWADSVAHSVCHEGACYARLVSRGERCQLCMMRARFEVDGNVYCLSCANDMCCAEQKAAIRRLK